MRGRPAVAVPALVVAAGVAWALCFERSPRPWLAVVGLAPTLVLLAARRPVLAVYGATWAFWAVSLRWIVDTLTLYGGLPGPLAWGALVLLAGILAAFGLPFAWLGAQLWRAGGLAALLGVPASWVLSEWLRSWALTGFPWNLAAYAWSEMPGALPLASWIGAYGVSFLVVLANLGVAWACSLRHWRRGVAAALAPALPLALGFRWALPPAIEGERLPIRIVQPNIPNLTSFDTGRVEAHYARLLALSAEACDRPALLVWPESAAWPYLWQREERLRRDVAALAARDCPVLLNTPWSQDGAFSNAAILVAAEGIAGRYDKRHLVPFGEYVPAWLPVPGVVARLVGSFVAGEEARSIPWRGEGLGLAICYEIVFPGEVARLVREGATILVTITNDAWYGDTAAPWQHLRAARFRAAENRRPLLRAAITGVSAVIRPDGSVESQLGVGEKGVIAAVVRGRADRTLYGRGPWLVPVTSALVVAASLAGRTRAARRCAV